MDEEVRFFGNLPHGAQPVDVVLLDGAGQPIRAALGTARWQSPGGTVRTTREVAALAVPDWFRACRMSAGDHVVVTVDDWKGCRYRLEHVRGVHCNRFDIARRNSELADSLFDLLEQAQAEWIPINEAVPMAYARLAGATADPAGVPAHGWHLVVHTDRRMTYTPFAIKYEDAWAEPGQPFEAEAGMTYPRVVKGKRRRAANR